MSADIVLVDACDPVPTTTPAPARKRGGGPKTAEGLERSRRNALKHGLRSKVLLPDDLAQAVAERSDQLAEEYEPETPFEVFLVGQAALASARLERCAEMAMADLGRCVRRAELCWEIDRRQVIEDIGAKLAKDPSRVIRALRGSKQGADWLIERWEGLGESLRSNGAWDDAQRRLAFDLLGVPLNLRDGSRRVPPEGDAKGLAALVEREVAGLVDDREAVLDELDEADRMMAVSGMPMDEDAKTARLRKYEASSRRALNWALGELRQAREALIPAIEPPRPMPPAPPPPPRIMPSVAAPKALADRPAPSVMPSLVAPAKPVAARPAIIPSPVPTLRSAKSAANAPRNRRERRAMEKQARQAARRAGVSGR